MRVLHERNSLCMPELATQQARKPDAENVGHLSKVEVLLFLLVGCPKHSLSRIHPLTHELHISL